MVLELLLEFRCFPGFEPLNILFYPFSLVNERIVVNLLNLKDPMVLVRKFLVLFIDFGCLSLGIFVVSHVISFFYV